MKTKIMKFRAAVDKKILVLLAGTMWCGVGLMLIRYAISWLSIPGTRSVLIFGISGIIAGLLIHRFGFLNLANKNLKRLLPMTEKKCLFSFMTWKSYLIVPVMVSMGIFLRHSAIPKQYLSVIYNGIGFGLFLSGARYFKFFIALISTKTQFNNPELNL
jgi:hypothetical protein